MSKKVKLPFRQVHLDYHTSELMGPIAHDFDSVSFVNTLKRAYVNSITCFARCHHGWLYYPSTLYPERIHPELKTKNLLGEQLEACKKEGIRAPIYVTVQWDHFTANEHPEWLCRDEKGQLIEPLFTPGFYRYLCINTPYRDFLKTHVKELVDLYGAVDGFFFDILWLKPCSCPVCREKMYARNLDWHKPEDRETFASMTLDDFINDMTAFVHSLVPDASVYYNSGDVQPYHKNQLPDFTHLEFDALPSGHGNYDQFPIITRTARTYGLDYAGHTGKFHTGWGDMHSYKTQEALEYECFMLLALGGKCIIGDQLPPSGLLDGPAYDLIGSVYKQVAAKEPWCIDSKPVSEIGIFYTDMKALRGAHKLLKASAFQYDIIDKDVDFSNYKLIILPDRVSIPHLLAEKFKTYIKDGGKILATFLSGTNDDNTEFLLPLGVDMHEHQEDDVDGNLVRGLLHFRKDYADYIFPEGPLGLDLPETELVMYSKANNIHCTEEGTVLVHVVDPHFFRNAAHFCSHVQTPSSGKKGLPGAVSTFNSLYLAHNVFEMYDEYAAKWCKTYVRNAINLLLGEPLVQHNGPTTLEAILTEQEQENRYVLHLLHYVPIKRAQLLEIIEDKYPLHHLTFTVKLPEPIKGLIRQPSNTVVDYTEMDGYITFTLDELNGHDMIVMNKDLSS